jgi:hypothetical protein
MFCATSDAYYRVWKCYTFNMMGFRALLLLLP